MINNASDTREKLLDIAFEEIYTHGYQGAATATILKHAAVTKGSMYHHFASKKALALAVIKERITPKMDAFFDFTPKNSETTFEAIQRVFGQIAKQEKLIMYGCPMHRLLVEMAPLDKDFDTLLSKQFEYFTQRLSRTLQVAIERKELKNMDCDSMARFIITTIWGEISLPPSLSSCTHFENQLHLIGVTLQQFRHN